MASPAPQNRTDFYAKLYKNVENLVHARRDMISNTANVAALIYHELHKHYGASAANWVGFYLLRPIEGAAPRRPEESKDSTPSQQAVTDRILMLGPFHGLPAVVPIPFSKGVCGACASLGKTQLVRDVHQVPYHIACDSASRSEIVIPIFGSAVGSSDRQLVAVLDMDSPVVDGYTELDQAGLEMIADLLGNSCDWVSLNMPVAAAELEGGVCTRISH